MNKSWPEFVDPILLADKEAKINGNYPLAKLDRLLPLLYQNEGEVIFQLFFTKDHDKRRIVSGKITARLCLTCQRCLAALWLNIDHEVLLGIVENLVAADELPSELEPLLVEKGIISLREIVEDELILSLPVVAMHEPNHCPAQEILVRYNIDKNDSATTNNNPFSILKS